MRAGSHLPLDATAWPGAASQPKRIRRWRKLLLRPAVAISLLLHAAAIGVMFWFGFVHVAETTVLQLDCRVHLDQDREITEDSLPVESMPLPDEARPEAFELPPDPVQEVPPRFEEDEVEFEVEETPVLQAPAVEIVDVPLRVAVPRPRPTPPPPAPTVRVPPSTVTHQAPRPRPAPRAAPRGAPTPRRHATLQVLYRPDPRRYYPAEARAQRLAGTVRLVLLIDASGRVADVTLETSSGYDALDRAAMTFARAYRFNADAGWRRIRLPVTFR